MILTCIKCGTRYVVADSAIGKDGRTVRCVNCQHTWFQQGVDISPVVEAAIVPPTVSPAATRRPILPPGFNLPAVIAMRDAPRWMRPACVVLIILIMMMAPFADRKSILAHHPELSFLTEPLGIYYTEGLAIADVNVVHNPEKETQLEVSCNIINESKGSRTMPNLRYMVLDPDGKILAKSGNMAETGKNMVDGDVQPCKKFVFDDKDGVADRVIIDLADPFDMKLRKQ